MSYGKFIIKKFKNKKIELFLDTPSEWISYSDGDSQSYMIIVAIPTEYDEECGILTLKNDQGQVFYLSDDCIQVFWEHGTSFNLIENLTSTIKTGKKLIKKRDIM